MKRKIPLVILLMITSACVAPYYIPVPLTGIPDACRPTERTDTGFTCIDTYGRFWYCRWVEDKDLDGICVSAKPIGETP